MAISVKFGARRGRAATAVVGLLGVLALAGCGSASNNATAAGGSNSSAPAAATSSSGGSLPKTIPVAFDGELTGPAGYAGQAQLLGMKWAIKQANASGELHGSKLVLTSDDNATNPSQAASLMSQIANSNAVAVFGPLASAVGMAAGPIAQRAQLPYIATASVDPSILQMGDYVYRTMPSMVQFSPLLVDTLAKRGVKTVKMVYFSDNPTLVDMSQNLLPAQMKAHGITLEGSTGVPTTTTDYSALITKLMAGHPQAIGLMVIGPAFAALIKGLRDAGYTGQLFGDESGSIDVLQPAGSAANGFFSAAGFDQSETQPSVKAFVKSFKAANPSVSTVNLYDAAGAAAVQFLVDAIKAGGGATRAAIHRGMALVAKSGFTGAYGPESFSGRGALSPGLVVQYENGSMHIVGHGTGA